MTRGCRSRQIWVGLVGTFRLWDAWSSLSLYISLLPSSQMAGLIVPIALLPTSQMAELPIAEALLEELRVASQAAGRKDLDEVSGWVCRSRSGSWVASGGWPQGPGRGEQRSGSGYQVASQAAGRKDLDDLRGWLRRSRS